MTRFPRRDCGPFQLGSPVAAFCCARPSGDYGFAPRVVSEEAGAVDGTPCFKSSKSGLSVVRISRVLLLSAFW